MGYVKIETLYPELSNETLRAATDGCYIVYWGTNVNMLLAVTADDWPTYEAQGWKAIGVLICTPGRKPLIVSSDVLDCEWSTNRVLVDEEGVITDSEYDKAFTDYTGKERTAAIMAKGSELFDGDADTWKNKYAAAWCNSYEKLHDYGGQYGVRGIGAGKWWLPSIGELLEIWAHKDAIKRCFSVISGATPFVTNRWFWSSTERNTNTAWNFDFTSARLPGAGAKNSSSCFAIPVTSFH